MPWPPVIRAVVVAALALVVHRPAAAQAVDAQGAPDLRPDEPPRAVVEGAAGWVGFGDDGIVHHTLLGLGARYYVTRRISIGPELQYMMGPDSDRDLVLTGNVVVDVLAPTATRPRRTTPYLVLGGGLFRHANDFGGRSFSSTEGAYTAGVGVRTWLSPRAFLAGDARIGWEPHIRLAGVVGLAF
jgi:hypothetical protein